MTTPDPVPDKGSVSQSEPNQHTIDAVVLVIPSLISSTSVTSQSDSADPRTELDSYANMIVLGKHSYVSQVSLESLPMFP